jgi:predicted CxxxxCH...CXXCH cytochrome family protein
MRLVPISTVALALTSVLSACGDAQEVTEREAGGGHPIPFVAEHTAAARANIASCRVCHGNDFGGAAAQSCNDCHTNQLGFADDWRDNCTFCHGGGVAGRDPTWAGTLGLAAPPQSADGAGAQDNTNPKVGAHQAHLTAGTFSSPIACGSCHTVPPTTFAGGSLNHVGGTADVEFATTLRQGVTSPGYAGAGGTCAVVCHGTTAALGNNTSPAWTSAGGVACGDCHTTTPTSGQHTFHLVTITCGVTCASCHPGYALPATVNLANHANGVFEAAPITTTATFSSWPASCTACHAAGVPPCVP